MISFLSAAGADMRDSIRSISPRAHSIIAGSPLDKARRMRASSPGVIARGLGVDCGAGAACGIGATSAIGGMGAATPAGAATGIGEPWTAAAGAVMASTGCCVFVTGGTIGGTAAAIGSAGASRPASLSNIAPYASPWLRIRSAPSSLTLRSARLALNCVMPWPSNRAASSP